MTGIRIEVDIEALVHQQWWKLPWRRLEECVEDILSIAREKDYAPAAGWERRMKSAIAQVFLLGMDVGWDKCVAVMDNKFRDETGAK